MGRHLHWPGKYNEKSAGSSAITWYWSGDITYHGTIAEQRTRSAERVGDEVERLYGAGFEIPECTPSRMVIDLQRVVGSPVEPYYDGRRDDDSFKR